MLGPATHTLHTLIIRRLRSLRLLIHKAEVVKVDGLCEQFAFVYHRLLSGLRQVGLIYVIGGDASTAIDLRDEGRGYLFSFQLLPIYAREERM